MKITQKRGITLVPIFISKKKLFQNGRKMKVTLTIFQHQSEKKLRNCQLEIKSHNLII